MSIVFKKRANASAGLALEFTLQKTEWDTSILVGLLEAWVHVEKSYQSLHAACFRDNIERYRHGSGHQRRSIFCNISFSMLPPVHNITYFLLFS